MTDKLEGDRTPAARRYSRRGALRLLGAGMLGATAAAAFPAAASADWGPFRRGSVLRNTTGPQWYTVDNGQNQNVLAPTRGKTIIR